MFLSGLLAVAVLGQVDYERLQYEDSSLLHASSRVRRDIEGSGLLDYDTEEDDDEDDQEYFSSAEILPTRQPGT